MTDKELLDAIKEAHECAKTHGFIGTEVELFFPIEGMKEDDPIIGQELPGTLKCKACCSGGRCGICCTFPL
jgi:hypothetical protein